MNLCCAMLFLWFSSLFFFFHLFVVFSCRHRFYVYFHRHTYVEHVVGCSCCCCCCYFFVSCISSSSFFLFPLHSLTKATTKHSHTNTHAMHSTFPSCMFWSFHQWCGVCIGVCVFFIHLYCIRCSAYKMNVFQFYYDTTWYFIEYFFCFCFVQCYCCGISNSKSKGSITIQVWLCVYVIFLIEPNRILSEANNISFESFRTKAPTHIFYRFRSIEIWVSNFNLNFKFQILNLKCVSSAFNVSSFFSRSLRFFLQSHIRFSIPDFKTIFILCSV